MIMTMKKCLDKSIKFYRLIARLNYMAMLILGVALFGGAALLAFYIEQRSASIGIALFGGFASSVLIAFSLPRYAKSLSEDDLDKRNALDDAVRLERENAAVTVEIERYKRMRVNVDAHRSILQLGLIELNMQITDFKKNKISSHERNKVGIKPSSQVDYLGVLTKKFKANLGVDLTKLRFDESDSGKLIVSGLTTEFQGMKDEEDDWNLREIRKKTESKVFGMGSGSCTIVDDIPLDEFEEQAKELTIKIRQGFYFGHVDQHIKKMASEVIRLVLAPLGKEIEFREQESVEGVGFLEYLVVHNNEMDSQIRDLESGSSCVQNTIESDSHEIKSVEQ